jgi:hypothetical protein
VIDELMVSMQRRGLVGQGLSSEMLPGISHAMAGKQCPDHEGGNPDSVPSLPVGFARVEHVRDLPFLDMPRPQKAAMSEAKIG